jgi:virginiamycin B lyase
VARLLTAVIAAGALSTVSAAAVDGARIVATINAGVAPIGLAAGAGSLWVADYGGGTLVRIDPARNRVLKRIKLDASPYGVTAGAGGVWVSAFDAPYVSRVDPATNRVVARVQLGAAEHAGITANGHEVWVAMYGSGRIARIDATTNKVKARIAVGGRPEAVVFAAGSAWVPNEDGTVARIDPASGGILKRIRVGADPDYAIWCHGRLWVSDLRGPKLSVIDPATNSVVAAPAVGVGSAGLACGPTIWSANYDSGEVLELNATSGKALRHLMVGSQPREVLVAFGDVWVSNQRSGTVVRIRRG